MITIRKGTICDTESLIDLMVHVQKNMDHKEWLFLDSPDEIRKMMSDGTMSLWVATEAKQIIAAFDVLHPGLKPFNYGYSIDLSDEELLQVVNMDTIVVHPDYRGRGLQIKLMQSAEKEIVRSGKHILMCTVHPENRYSLINVLSQGYSICRTIPMYGSVRHVLMKKIK